jgi:hypothetical protein
MRSLVSTTALAVALSACGSSKSEVVISGLAANGTACVPSSGCDCSAAAGDQISFMIGASDSGGIDSLGYQITFATSGPSGTALTGATPLASPSTSAIESFSFQVPANVGTETAQLSGQATDRAGKVTSADPVAVCVVPRQIQPVVAWLDHSSGSAQIYVKRWNGTSWDELGGSASGSGVSATTGNAEAPVVAVQPDGNPVVAWLDRPSSSGPTDVLLKRWNGTAWEELGGSASGGGVSQSAGSTIGSQDPSVAVDSTGQIYVAWKFADTPNNVCCNLWIYVKRWNGTSWEELGGSGSGMGVNGTSDGSAPVIKIDGADRPVVAWNEQMTGCAVWLRRWNGSAWEELAGSGSSSGVSPSGVANGDPALDIGPDGNPVVSWGSAHTLGFDVRRWDGSAWNDVGAPGSTGQCEAGGGIPITVGASGHTTVAVSDPFSDPTIYVQQWDGSMWNALPSLGLSTRVSLASGGDDVLLAWSNAAGAVGDVFVKRWDGSSWQDLGGSGSGSGISGTNGGAAPFIATR